MYSAEIAAALKKAGAEIGDRVKVEGEKGSYAGILMPKVGSGDKNVVVIKLDSGYNVGVEFGKKTEVELVEKGVPVGFVASEEKGASKADVSILGCGGTVASRVNYKTGGVFPAFSPSDLLLSFPELGDVASISARKLFSLLSEDIMPAHWEAIAKEVAGEIKDGRKGVVLMHGTDTLHYTSAALSFMLQELPVPVVLVGAQRSSDRGSSDNAMNMLCAVLAAKSDIAEVGVCMHASGADDFCYLHSGVKVRKMHSSSRGAFRSINTLPVAKIFYKQRKVEPMREHRKRDEKGKLVLDGKMNPDVCLIWIHPGIKPEFVESLAKLYDGVVVAGTGLGHVPANPENDKFAKSTIPAFKSLIERGIPVVMAPQTIGGRVNMNVYAAGRMAMEAGIIGNECDWLPEVAFVKLMWVLGHTKDMKKVKEMMLRNYCGEISARTTSVEEIG